MKGENSKKIHDILLRCKGGPHEKPKKTERQQDKIKLKKMLKEDKEGFDKTSNPFLFQNPNKINTYFNTDFLLLSIA